MGYNIYYEGTVNIDKPLDDETYRIIQGLCETRRMIWDTNKLEQDGIARRSDIGYFGEFFFGFQDVKPKKQRELEKRYVIDHNCPPPGQPSLWGVWKVTEDRMGLVWNGCERSYRGHEWLQYLVKMVLAPRGYHTKGIVNWFTEDSEIHKWHTIVDGISVRKRGGYCKQQKEPDIDAWSAEQEALYKEDQRKILQNLIEQEVEFIIEESGERYSTDSETVLWFKVFIDNSVIEAVYDRNKVCLARYRLRNISRIGDQIVYDEHIENIYDADMLARVQKLLTTYISAYPNFLETAV